MNRGRFGAFLVAVAILVGVLIYASMNTVQAECELCVTYGDRTECRRGSGSDDDEAVRAAQKAACGVMASGMSESVNCQNTPPSNVRCQR